MNPKHRDLQQKFRKANEEMLAAHAALAEKLSEENIGRFRDAVHACKKAQSELAADGWSGASKRLDVLKGSPR